MPGIVTTPFKRKITLATSQSAGLSPSIKQNTGAPYLSRAAALSSVTFSFPLPLESRAGETGAQLDAVDIPFRLSTKSAVSNITATVYRRNASVPTVSTPGNITISTVAGTLTGSSLSANAADRLLHWVPTTPAFDYSKDAKADYTIAVTFNLATTSVLRVYEPILYYSLPS